MGEKIKVGLFGSQGYVGRELVALIARHPYMTLSGIFDRSTSVEELLAVEVLFLATPPEVSMELVKQLQDKNLTIIDLSGAFRLPVADFTKWYGLEHTAPELLKDAQYGLSPWGIKHSHNVSVLANPGCYATCALMSLIPLIKMGILKPNTLIIDAKSGVSGAGKKPNEDLLFCEMSENFFPYKIGKHQHVPEIKNALLQFTGKSCDLTFVTQMLPIVRGISMSIYADGENNFTSDLEISAAIQAAYEMAYEDYPLAKFGKINAGNACQDKYLLSLKSVAGTPEIHIGYFVESGKVMIFSSIDNLLKGAASQAIENFNAIYHLPLETGLGEII